MNNLTPKQAGEYLAKLINARGKSWNYWRNKAVKGGFKFDKGDITVEGASLYYTPQSMERMAEYLNDNGLVIFTKKQEA